MIERFDVSLKLGRKVLNEFMKKTENVMRIVFQAVKMNIAFYSYPLLVDILKWHNVDIGIHHQGRKGMQLITSHISAIMHKQLVAYLLLKQP